MSKIILNDTTRVIRDCTWPSVEIALNKRLEELEKDPTKLDEFKLCSQRYANLNIDDVRIEPVQEFSATKRLVSIISRKAGFARVDIEVEKLAAGDILSRIGKKRHTVKTKSELIEFINAGVTPEDMVYVESNKAWHGFIPGVNVEAEMAAYPNAFFNKGSWVVSGPQANPVDNGDYQLRLEDPAVITGQEIVKIQDIAKLTAGNKK